MNLKKSLVTLMLISVIGSSLLQVALGQDQVPQSAAATVTFWYTENDAEKPGIVALVSEFEALNPTIDVQATQISFFDARNLYTNSYIAKDEPSVMRATRDWIPEFAAAGMLQPLTDTFLPEDYDDFLEIALEMVTYPDSEDVDQIYAYPQLVDTPAIMYNIDILEAAGIDTSAFNFTTSWTWDEYWDILLQVNGTEYTYATETNEVYATQLAGMMFGGQPYMFGQGAEMFYNDTVAINTAAIDSTESRASLEFLKDLTDSSVTPDWLDQGWGPLNPDFRAGKVAMINQGPWELKQNIDDELIFEGGDNLGIVQLPHDEDGNRGAPVGCHGYIISSHVDTATEEFDAAVEFARFMSGEHAQKEGAVGYYHVPSRRSVMNLTEVQNAATYPYVKAYWDAVQAAFRVPVSKDWAQVEQVFGDQINEYLAGEATLDECIAVTLVQWAEFLPNYGVDVTDTTGTNTTTNGTETTDTDVITSPDSIPGFPMIGLVGMISLAIFVISRKYRT